MLSTEQQEAFNARRTAIEECLAKGMSTQEIIDSFAATGVVISRSAVDRVRRRRPSTSSPVVNGNRVGRSLKEFRQLYDKDTIVPEKIRAGLAKLGRDGWEAEPAFAKLCNVTLSDLSIYREQFIDYVVVIGRTGKKAWAGRKETAEEMRRLVPA